MNRSPIPKFQADLEKKGATTPRRHDLDALRAAAMLLGIAYHCALSFSLGAGWMVQDERQSTLLYVFQAFVHGFRMPLFMLLSGFFTALFWRRHGLRALLLNRLRRVLLPCLAGLFTVVPAIHWTAALASKRQDGPLRLPCSAVARPQAANVAKFEGAPGAQLVGLFPEFSPPQSHQEFPYGDWSGSAPGEEGHVGGRGVFDGSCVKAESPARGPSPDRQVWPPLSVSVGRHALTHKETGLDFESAAPRPSSGKDQMTWMERPVLVLVWFLWFLLWFLPIFSVYAILAVRFGWRMRRGAFCASQWSLIWLLPLAFVPASHMGVGGHDFGPETSMSLLPAPHVLTYYAVFFGFGVLYHEQADERGPLVKSWSWTFPVALLVVFPLALDLASGTFGIWKHFPPRVRSRSLMVFFQVLYAWLMSFACIGMFSDLVKRGNRLVRYLVDASYWCYLVHLPVVILAQTLVRRWPLAALPKFTVVFCIVLLLTLFGYEMLVRDRWMGRFLNGAPVRIPSGKAGKPAPIKGEQSGPD